MISDINKFNDYDCKLRSENIANNHDFDDFKVKMQMRLKQQQTNANRADSNSSIPKIAHQPLPDMAVQ